MANIIQVWRLKISLVSWNRWRTKKPNARIDLYGANLRSANLMRANLRSANLRSADLRDAKLTGADLTNADLTSADLTSADLKGVKLTGANLYGAELNQAALTHANLRGAILYETSLRNTNLFGANLTDANLIDAKLNAAKALSTNFSNATLTGACILNWNINSDTYLKNAICDYIYLKNDQQERRPSDPNRNFEPEQFAKLVGSIPNTVDLIFSKGADWKAVAYSIKNTQVLNEDTPLAIQSIENKGDGVVLIKVNVPENADKGKIEGDFWQGYEFANKTLKEQYDSRLLDKDRFIDKQDQQINKLFYSLNQAQEKLGEVPRLMSGMGKREQHFYGDVGNAGDNNTMETAIGKAEGDVIRTKHNYASEQKQTLAEAAEEIQKLLQQLEQANSDATLEQQEAYVDAAMPKPLKERLISALSAMTDAAIEEFLKRPGVKVVASGVKAWILPG